MGRLKRVDAGIGPEAIAEIVHRDGACVMENAVEPRLMEELHEEMRDFIDATPPSNVDLNGRLTRRTGGLAGRSAAARALIMHETVIEAGKLILAASASMQISNTEIISIGPGETLQPVHRDQDIWNYPFPPGFEVTFSVMWPITDFTEENGATRLVLGSHRYGYREVYREQDVESAEMKRGSVLIWSGALAHGGGANRTASVRYGVMLAYSVGWLRQEENQYLAVPHEIAANLDRDLLKMLGYSRGGQAIGNGVDRSHPLGSLFPELARPGEVELELLDGYQLSRSE